MITLIGNDDGMFTETGTDAVWVHDSYTEPRESLLECDDCGTEIEEWDLFTCMNGGEAAHTGCVQIITQ